MAIAHTVGFADILPSPWANGRGETVELAREPRTGAFRWRLSVATIAEAAEFSPLPGVARALMALDGPLDLVIDGQRVALARHEAVRFDGEQAVSALAPDAPQHDLNLMVRGGVPELQAVSVDGRLETPADAVAALVLDGELMSLGRMLRPADAVVTAGAAISLRGRGTVALARILPTP